MTDPREQFDELLDRWLDDELTPVEQEQWEALLEANPDLAEEARQERDIVGLLQQSAAATKAPPSFSHDVLEGIQGEVDQQEESYRWAGLQRIGLLAAGLILFGSIYYFFGESTFEDPPIAMEIAEVADEIKPEQARQPATASRAESPPLMMAREMDAPMAVEEPSEPHLSAFAMLHDETPMTIAALRGKVVRKEIEVHLLARDRGLLETMSPPDHEIVALAGNDHHVAIRTALPGVQRRVGATLSEPTDAGELAAELATARATWEDDQIDIVLEMANGSLLDDRVTIEEIFKIANLDPSTIDRGQTVAAWEFTTIQDALLAVELMEKDKTDAAQRAASNVMLLPLGNRWVVLVHDNNTDDSQ